MQCRILRVRFLMSSLVLGVCPCLGRDDACSSRILEPIDAKVTHPREHVRAHAGSSSMIQVKSAYIATAPDLMVSSQSSGTDEVPLQVNGVNQSFGTDEAPLQMTAPKAKGDFPSLLISGLLGRASFAHQGILDEVELQGKHVDLPDSLPRVAAGRMQPPPLSLPGFGTSKSLHEALEKVRALVEHRWKKWIIVLFTFVFLIAFVFWVRRIGGRDLMITVFPVGSAVCLCILTSLIAYRLGPPWNHFSPTTALVTIVIVMEMGTFERFMIKISLRGLGTIFGGVLAVICAELSLLLHHNMFFMFVLCFVVFTTDGVMAKRHKEFSYVFLMISVTFSLVFFGYLQKGWQSVISRLVSVLTGEAIAVVSTVCFIAGNGDWKSSKSSCTIVSKVDQVLNKVLVAVDFAFARNIIHSLADDATENVLSDLQKQTFQKEVTEFFGLDRELVDLQPLKALCASSTFTSFPIDAQATGLQNECKAIWADLNFVRSVLPVTVTDYFFPELPNFGGIMDRLQPLYIQASALAHSTCVDPAVWQREGPNLDAVRGHIQRVQEPWGVVTKLLIDVLKDAHHTFASLALAASREKLYSAYKDLASILESGHTSLVSARTLSQNDSGVEKSKLWRFDAYCQCLDHIIVEFSSLAMLSMRVLRFAEEGTESGKLLQRFAELASLEADHFDEVPEIMRCKSMSEVMRQMRQQNQAEDGDDGGD